MTGCHLKDYNFTGKNVERLIFVVYISVRLYLVSKILSESLKTGKNKRKDDVLLRILNSVRSRDVYDR